MYYVVWNEWQYLYFLSFASYDIQNVRENLLYLMLKIQSPNVPLMQSYDGGQYLHFFI